jgi:serine/threonine-protein kinase HipA
MTSRTEKEAFVWIWLPDETEPVVAGRLETDNGRILFNYGRSYLSQLKTCLETAHNFLLSGDEAREIFGHLTAVIEQHWETTCEEAELNEVDKKLLWRRQFLNPYAVEQ